MRLARGEALRVGFAAAFAAAAVEPAAAAPSAVFAVASTTALLAWLAGTGSASAAGRRAFARRGNGLGRRRCRNHPVARLADGGSDGRH